MSTLRMGYDSMAAWTRSAFYMDMDQCRPLKPYSTPAVPTLKRKPVASRQASVPAPLSHRAPTFAEAKSQWSPPPSPRTRSLRTASSSSSTNAPERQEPTPSTPTLSAADQHALSKNLYAAACAGDIKHMRLLLSLGCPVDSPVLVDGLYDAFVPAKSGTLSALAGAAYCGQLGAVRFLLSNGAAIDPSLKKSSSSPLHQACRANDTEMAAFLLEYGADVNSYNAFKTTPLMYASKGSQELVALLLAYSPDVHKLSFISTAAIHWALSPGNKEVMELLLQAGADPNHAMGDGSTPLHCAALSDLPKVARVLLRYGANPLKRNDEWKTPLQIASEMENWEVANVLREAETM